MNKKGFDCTVKLYFKKERGQHFFRYELPAEKTGTKTNSKGKEVPTYKKNFVRPDEYLPLSWYNSQRQWFPEPSSQAQRARNKNTQSLLDKLLMERQYLIDNGTIPKVDKIGGGDIDFSSGTRTAIAVHRGTLAVFDIKALVTGTFSNNKAALETA